MAERFVDRVASRPNRFKVTPEKGEPYYVTLERADEPVTLGTPLNAASLNSLGAELDGKQDSLFQGSFADDMDTAVEYGT